MADKETIIREIWLEHFGSIRDTYKRAKQRDATIKESDVKAALDKLEQRNRKRSTETNSFMAGDPQQQYHVDIADFSGDTKAGRALPFARYVFDLHTKILQSKGQKMTTAEALAFMRKQTGFNALFNESRWTVKKIIESYEPFEIEAIGRGKADIRLKDTKKLPHIKFGKNNLVSTKFQYALFCISAFSRKLHVVPMKTKSAPEVRDAMKECFKELKKPRSIYSDDDAAFQAEVSTFLNAEGVTAIVTRGHAAFAERAIRTIKKWLFLRQEAKGGSWDDLLPEVLKKYNSAEHRGLQGYTPNFAHKIENHLTIKAGVESLIRRNIRHPALDIGDKVRVLQKLGIMAKERTKEWGAIRTVLGIEKEK